MAGERALQCVHGLSSRAWCQECQDMAVTAERERVAKQVEDYAEFLKHTRHEGGPGLGWPAGEELCREIAAAIRARGTK